MASRVNAKPVPFFMTAMAVGSMVGADTGTYMLTRVFQALGGKQPNPATGGPNDVH